MPMASIAPGARFKNMCVSIKSSWKGAILYRFVKKYMLGVGHERYVTSLFIPSLGP